MSMFFSLECPSHELVNMCLAFDVRHWNAPHFLGFEPGWWYTYPSETYESQLFPIYRKRDYMFQTTNQIIYIYIHITVVFHKSMEYLKSNIRSPCFKIKQSLWVDPLPNGQFHSRRHAGRAALAMVTHCCSMASWMATRSTWFILGMGSIPIGTLWKTNKTMEHHYFSNGKTNYF